MSEQLLYTVPAAVDALGFSRSMLYEKIATGEIEVVKVGSRTLIPRDSLERFVAGLRDKQPVAS